MERALPEIERVGQHVGLSAERERLALVSLARVIECIAQAALDAHARVDRLLHGDFVLRAAAKIAAGARVKTFGVLAHDDKVDVLGALARQRRFDAGIELDGAQVDVEVELETEAEKDAFFEDPRLDVGMADGAEQDRVKAAQVARGGFRQHFAGSQVAVAAEIERRRLVLESADFGGRIEDLERLVDDLGAGAVARQNRNLVQWKSPRGPEFVPFAGVRPENRAECSRTLASLKREMMDQVTRVLATGRTRSNYAAGTA